MEKLPGAKIKLHSIATACDGHLFIGGLAILYLYVPSHQTTGGWRQLVKVFSVSPQAFVVGRI